MASRLYEILRKDVFSDIETGPRDCEHCWFRFAGDWIKSRNYFEITTPLFPLSLKLLWNHDPPFLSDPIFVCLYVVGVYLLLISGCRIWPWCLRPANERWYVSRAVATRKNISLAAGPGLMAFTRHRGLPRRRFVACCVCDHWLKTT